MWKLLVVLTVVLSSGSALAGRRPFIWGWDTEIVPRGEVELEQWLWGRTRAPGSPAVRSSAWIWWAPVIGLSDHLELALPFQIRAQQGVTKLESFEADLRIRLKERRSEEPHQALVRAVFHQAIDAATPSRIDANLSNSYQLASGLHLLLDLGVQVGIPALRGSEASTQVLATYSVGAAMPVSGEELKLGLEAFGELPVSGLKQGAHHFVGPDVSWSFGRMWLTAGMLVGVTPLFPETPRFMPRFIWAVAL